MTARRIDDLDVPLTQLKADIRALVSRQRRQAADPDFTRSIEAGLTESFADYCARTSALDTTRSSR